MCSNFKVIFWPILVIVKAAFLKNIYINSGSNYMYRNMYIICSHSRQLNTHCKVDKNRSESMLMSPSLTIHLHKLILKIILIFWKQTPFVSFDVFVALKWENQIPNWLPSLKSAQLLKQPVVQNGFKLPVFFFPRRVSSVQSVSGADQSLDPGARNLLTVADQAAVTDSSGLALDAWL